MLRFAVSILCLAIASCATPSSTHLPDLDAKRIAESGSVRLERIASGNAINDTKLGLVVFIGGDGGGNRFIAVAPVTPLRRQEVDLKSVVFGNMRALELHHAAELLRAVNFAIKDYNAEIGELHSIHTSFQSNVESSVVDSRALALAPVVRDPLSFTFANLGGSSEARIGFSSHGRSERELGESQLKHLGFLLQLAIDQVEAGRSE
jgi:hypothetical protein